MNESRARERRLLGATIASGMLVLLSHTGGPTACSAEEVVVRDVPQALPPDLEPNLVLRQAGTNHTIFRGTLVEINEELQGVLLGFYPSSQRVMIALDGEEIQTLPFNVIHSIAVLGEHRAGPFAGNGALIAGVTGAVAGFALGASYEAEAGPVCAFIVGAPMLVAGAGIGAVGGLAAGRPRREYAIGPWGWQIAIPAPRGTGARPSSLSAAPAEAAAPPAEPSTPPAATSAIPADTSPVPAATEALPADTSPPPAGAQP